MYLKKLELIGFKSFPEKTQFIFNRGITCIVGPNGCGKSNLLDALRWVLGEQRTSLLRGSKMEEVIFAGTRHLKPLGLSEVSLHICNDDGILPSQYKEVSISRRLFRSGESEYLINKNPCRLRDITDMFADTGMGTQTYAIIQQEMVDSILSDRNDERRQLFEEAAGITKYKQRRKAAERKLDLTAQDLLRLQDLLAEINTRVNSLKRQVSKAKRYKEFSEELRHWDLYSARTNYQSILEKRKALSLELKSFEDQKIAVETRLDTRMAELEKFRTDMTEIDSSLTDLGGKIARLSEEAHQLETNISVDREKRDNLNRSSVQNREDIEGLNKRRDVITVDKTKSAENSNRLDGEIEKASASFEEAITNQKKADSDYLNFRKMTEDESDQLLNLEGKISSGKADSANIEEHLKELQTEVEKQTLRKTDLTKEKSKRREGITNQQVIIEQSREDIAGIQNQIEEKNRLSEDAENQIDRLRDQMTEVTASYEANLARKNLLAEMIEHHEGYTGGVVAIFEIADRWVDITGTVADFIRPKEGYQQAIETALGEAAQYIICGSHTTALEAINHLRQEKAGQATFLILEKLASIASRPDLSGYEGVVGWADDMVEYDERYQLVPNTLLGRTVICEETKSAQLISESLPDGFQTVTLSGDKVGNKNGLVSGGASSEVSILGRQKEIEALEEKIVNLDRQSQNIKNRQSRLTLDIGELRQALSKLDLRLENDKDGLAEKVGQLKEEQFKINAADEILTSIDQHITQMTQRLDKLRHRQYTLSLDFDQLGRQREGISAAIANRKELLADFEEKSQKASEMVNRTQVEKLELESERSHHRSQFEYYEEMLSDIAQNAEQKKAQIESAQAIVVEIDARLKENEIALKETFDLRQTENSAQQKIRHSRDEINSELDQINEDVKNHRKEKDQLSEKHHQAEINLNATNSRMEQIETRIRGEYEEDINDVSVESPDPQLAEDQIAEKMETLRDRIRKMGIVNLLALEEYNEQKQRQEFLSRQLDDLISAKAILKSTINKINQTAKVMFLDTLEKARENFKQLYVELFTGGEANVFLEDESDPLDSRIEIVSRPRGKKPLAITQLSGGERALTATALLFALYMVKPSPFCFLDEIDAPLDDVNVGRFLKIVRKFSKQTQFIIITHNKITMEAADTLYGVTMEEPGVSKVVAVRFKKEGEDAVESGETTILDLHYSEENAAQAG